MELFGIVFSIPVAFVTSMRDTQDAARAAGVRLQPVEARTASEIDSAFAAITKERAGARRRPPTVFGVSECVEAGGLLAYGPSLSDGYRRAAT